MDHPFKTLDLISSVNGSSGQQIFNNVPTINDGEFPTDVLASPPQLLDGSSIDPANISNTSSDITKSEMNHFSTFDSFGACISSVDDLVDLWFNDSDKDNIKPSFDATTTDVETCINRPKAPYRLQSSSRDSFSDKSLDVSLDDDKNELSKILNLSVFETSNNVFSPIPLDHCSDVPSEEKKFDIDNILPNHNASQYNPIPLSQSSSNNMVPPNSHPEESCVFDSTLQSLPDIVSDHFDIDTLLGNPAKIADDFGNRETCVKLEDSKNDIITTEDEAFWESVDYDQSHTINISQNEAPATIAESSSLQTKSTELQRWTLPRKRHSKILPGPKMNLIALRRVKYVSNVSETKSASDCTNGETICFATHSASKTCTRKYGKKYIYMPSKSIKDRTKGIKGRKKYDQSNQINEANAAGYTMVLSIGETECNASIPVSTCVDNSSPQAFHEPLKNEISYDTEKKQSLYNELPKGFTDTSTDNIKINKTYNQVPLYAFDSKIITPSVSNPYYFSKPDIKKASKTGNHSFNLRNIVKIEIYTKPPKKMVITKSNNQSPTNKQANDPQEKLKSSPPTSLLSKFMDLLRNNIPDLTEGLMQQLCLPIDAVRRSYLTDLEVVCLKRQAHLLKTMKTSKTSHAPICHPPCQICTEIKSMEAELRELQKWKYNSIIRTKTWRTLHSQDNAENAISENNFTGNLNFCKPLFNSTGGSSWRGGLVLSKISPNYYWIANRMKSLANNTIEDAHKEDDSEDVSLSSSKAAEIPFCTPRTELGHRLSFRVADRARQWKKAQHMKIIKRLISRLEEDEERIDDDRNSCTCSDGCRSVLSCCCTRQGLDCLNCRCVVCENPLKIFRCFRINLFAVRMDSCLMQKIYELPSKEVQQILEEVQTVPCCRRNLKLFQLVPNVVVCPYCEAFLCYSWCFGTLIAEKFYERNHCIVCCKCQPPLHSHCYICENCTLSTINGKCLECEVEKIYTGISLG